MNKLSHEKGRERLSVIDSHACQKKLGSSTIFQIPAFNDANSAGVICTGVILSACSTAIIKLLESHEHSADGIVLCLLSRCLGAVLITAAPLVRAASALDLHEMPQYVLMSSLNWLLITVFASFWILHRKVWMCVGVELFILIQVVPISMLYLWGRASQLCLKMLSELPQDEEACM